MAKMLAHNSNGKPYPGCICCAVCRPSTSKKVKVTYKRLNRRQENVRWRREAIKDTQG